MDYQEFDKLDYTPVYGTVDTVGQSGRRWSSEVPVEQGRAMEADGIPVCWVYASVPEWAAMPVVGRIWLFVFRVFTWPARIGK